MGGSLLVGLSDDLAEAVARAGEYTVRVNARRRMPASGVLWPEGGVVVTADHVVELDEGITVGLPDGREAPAQLAGRDPGSDLALLRVEGHTSAPSGIFGSGQLKVGNLVLALGRPAEGSPMASIGIVSALTGPWRTRQGGLLESLVQTDVTLYPGFSGGPLVDASGLMVGLNSSILARGVSSALPADTVRRVVQALLSGGKVRRGYLGVSSQPVPLPESLSRQFGLGQESALLVVNVEPGGPADQGGLILGDVLVAMGGRPIRDAEDLQGMLGPDRVGAPTPVKILRGGELKGLTITVGERP